MIIRKIMQFFCVLLAAGIMAACGGGGGSLESGTGSGNGSGSNNGGNTTTKAKVAVELAVEYSNGSKVSKDHPAKVTATVTKDGVAYPGVLVKFALSQAGIGSFKTQTTAQTNSSGVATIPLYAGSSGVAAGGFTVTLEGLPSDVEVTLPGAKAFDTQGDDTTASTGAYAVSLKLVSKADPTQTITTVSQAVVGQVEISITKNNQAAVGELVTLTPATVGRLGVTTVQTLAGGKALVDLYAGDKEGAGELVASVGTGTEAASAKLVFSSKGDETVATKPIGNIQLQVKTLDGRDSNELGSSGLEQLELLAVVTDTNNVALSGQQVSFASDAGVLIALVNEGKTDATGTAIARISSATRQNKATQVTAKIQDKSSNQTVNIVGTTLVVESSSTNVSQGADSKFKFSLALRDSAGRAVINQDVTYASKLNNFAAGTAKTNNNGQVIIEYVPLTVGSDEITASAFSGSLVATPGLVSVRNDDFKLSLLNYSNAVAGLAQIPTNTDGSLSSPDAEFELTWPSGTINQSIKFESSAQGFVVGGNLLSSTTVNLDANKKAKVWLRSKLPASEVIVRATALSSGLSAEYRAQLVAVKPAKVTLSAESTVIAAGASSQLTAVVEDKDFAKVANAKVTFTIVSDSGGGRLIEVSAKTNANGEAKVVYQAGASTAQNAVKIKAEVNEIELNGVLQAVSGVSPATLSMTVAAKANIVRVSINQDKVVVSGETYIKKVYVFVNDTAGNPVPNVLVSASARPLAMTRTDSLGNQIIQNTYAKGYYGKVDGAWQKVVNKWCQNEDYNNNSTLETNTLECSGLVTPNVSEDDAVKDCGISLAGNGDGQLTPGAVGTLSIENSGRTDSTGQLIMNFIYPKRYATWASVMISASVDTPSGDQSSDQKIYDLQVLADDIKNIDVSPPNQTSPWGVTADCRTDQ